MHQWNPTSLLSRSVNRLFFFALFLVATCVSSMAWSLPLNEIKLPPGFKINLFTDKVPGARSLTYSPKGILYVGTRREGKVYAVLDRNQDGKADQVYTIASGLNQPNGVAFRNGSLYVAEIHRVIRFDQIEQNLAAPPKPVEVRTFPKETHHGWRFIAFGPDGKLYVPIGAPCNICESPPPFASITRMNPDGSGFEIFAKGVRNSVGFAWHPTSKVLWFTDNGRDWLGDELPPDELNRAPRAGMNFGYPYCYGKNIPDPKFKKSLEFCSQFTPPVLELPAHVAALGMRFYTGKKFPAKFHGNIFIAEHGSWNRSKKIGYQVIRVQVQDGKVVQQEAFATGWLNRFGQNWGRPVDVQVAPDGSLLVSDDQGGAIYRITYEGKV